VTDTTTIPAARPTRPRAAGWNTWDVQFHTGYAHLPSGVRVRFALASPDGTVFDGFTWRHGLTRLGHHTVDGRYAQVTVNALDTDLDLRFTGDDDTLDATATVSGPADVVVIVDRMPHTGDSTPLRLGGAHEASSGDAGAASWSTMIELGGLRWRLESWAPPPPGAPRGGRPRGGAPPRPGPPLDF
jgi:hypothetical protein